MRTFFGLVLFLVMAPVLRAAEAKPGQTWRLEGPVGSAVEEAVPGGAVAKTRGGKLTWSADVPGKYVYDPLTGKSQRNTSSLQLTSDDKAWAWLEAGKNLPGRGGSFTLEVFASPSEDARRTMVLAGQFRQGREGCEAGLQVRRLNSFNQSYWGGFLAEPTGPRREWSTGHYVTISRLHAETLGWRHLALVYDARTRTATCYQDYWLTAGVPIENDLRWDEGLFCIGGTPQGNGFHGKIDEVRLTREALPPAKFLRAVDTPLENVDFSSPETILPRGTGYIDLREGFGARGDGVTDDTAAFEKAFAVLPNKVPGAYYTLYVPPGTYRVSRPLWFSRFFVLQGAGREATVIRLEDNAKAFQDPNKPEPVLRASSTRGAPGSNPAVNGSSIGLYIHDLTIDTGKGNPGVKALEYHSNNHGALERVDLRAGDGRGVVGLDLTHKTNGPALIKELRVFGFQRGITSKYAEYSLTLEHITLQGQSEVGILNEGNLLAIRELTSINKVPALVSRSNWSMVTLLDARLTGGAADGTAIEAEGALYARNIQVEGYRDSIRRPRAQGEVLPALQGNVSEFVGDHLISVRNSPKESLKLPIEETPKVPWGDIRRDWVSIQAFAEKKQGNDWAPALEAALASGAKTIYFPQGGYEIARPVSLRGAVTRLFGMRAHLVRPRGSSEKSPLLIYEDPDASKMLVIERMDVAGLEHRSPGTLVLKHSTPERYTTTAGCGKLFAENVAGTDWHFDHPQQVWVRQWNPESHNAGPNITSRGATIWSLGFKTEYESSKLWASKGARTEILGGFIYPVNRGIPQDRPIFRNEDSTMSLIYGMSVYVAGHDLQVLDIRKGEAIETRSKEMLRLGARLRMDLYRSDAEGK